MFAAASHGSWHTVGVQEIFVEGTKRGMEDEGRRVSQAKSSTNIFFPLFIFTACGLLEPAFDI